ncbi:MAG: phosphoenolpyruvate carboxykinase (GTP), partial [Clostridia bacterium]|nr:phosphoenolpyruvate carboxykinase (GTP) [Clostridia bacterium]
PGFGDNLRVLDWMLKRCEGTVDAQETAIGYVPNVDDINLDGLDFSKEDLVGILNVDKDLWRAEVPGIKEFYAKFGDKLPATLQAELDTLESKLND